MKFRHLLTNTLVVLSIPLITCFFFVPAFGNTLLNDTIQKGDLFAQPSPTPVDANESPNESTEEIPTLTETTPQPASDLDFVSYRYHSWDIPGEANIDSSFWIDIDLTNQMLFAFRDNQLINGFKISSGTASYKTITGTYKIFSKYPAITMTGPGYDLPDVPFSMFFYKGYSIHGTYWHNNFGTPMSHGCVNMNTADAAWIYSTAPVGTFVTVHY